MVVTGDANTCNLRGILGSGQKSILLLLLFLLLLQAYDLWMIHGP